MTSRYSNLERPGLDENGLREALCRPQGPYGRLDLVEATGSTNTDLAEHCVEDPGNWPDLSVLTAEEQTAGRGRLDRIWTAPERSSLFVSVLLRPHNPEGRPLPTQSYAWMSLLAALALSESIEERTEISPQLKWPNDVHVDGRKLAGVLAQLVPGANAEPPAVVVGAGVNVSLTDQELPVPTATSLLLEYAATTDRNILLKAYLRRLSAHYGDFTAVDGDATRPWKGGASLLTRVSERMVTLGQDVQADLPNGSVITGRAMNLDSHGALVVRDEDGERHTVSAGDVVHLRPLTL
ncbi:biotin--[acetyl-CoA-carboxylase] ligase [Arthrobacter sp. EH-1B-1]|uniref:biotin--[biotin carboxyl-carrier protein] ligase n=1 Tax=Arthrobacter vasquezii TaxID=2977629 RepID=A0ABT6CV53_9MICC|nr:biotin--[acetyl-CoA-carboxylase] ligase [Arthrobacter vasquezii]MDF9277775.1 biotin--[acetyl-CoA-carboxylase] ligase [Arthrobacter vasquezii]